MASADYAIVCDSGCDLPLDHLEGLGVALVSMRVRANGVEGYDLVEVAPANANAEGARPARFAAEAPTPQEFAATFRELAQQGYRKIVSIHVTGVVSQTIGSALEAARTVEKDGVAVEVVDSLSASAATGLIVGRVARGRKEGWDFDQAVAAARTLAEAVALFFVPTEQPRPIRNGRRVHRGLVGHAKAIRLRVTGELSLCALRGGHLSEAVRSTSISDLTGRIAQTMSAIAREAGPLCYVEVDAGAPSRMTKLEKPLDTNEFESRRLGVTKANATTVAFAGAGSIGIAIVPQRVFDDPLGAADGDGRNQNDNA